MKYFVLTIIFFIIIAFLILGSIFYTSYNSWEIKRESIFERLIYLKDTIERDEKEVFLTPELKKTDKSLIFDRNLEIICEIFPESRKIIDLNEIPPRLIDSFLIFEDPGFYTRKVFTVGRIEMLRVIVRNTFPSARRGRTLAGKMSRILLPKEEKKLKGTASRLSGYLTWMFCTFELEKRFGRDDIMSFYINSVYFGHNLYGIENATRFYFNKTVSDLNLFEAALLFSLATNPERLSPHLYPGESMKKHKVALNRLAHEGIMDTRVVMDGFVDFWEQFLSVNLQYDIPAGHVESNLAPYFIEYVRQVLKEKTGKELFNIGDLRIYTTLDIKKQIIAREALVSGLTRQSIKISAITGSGDKNVEGAILVMDPVNGQIHAMVGGSGFTPGDQFNRASSAKRQIGSAFKPFVYAAAFEILGLTKDTVFVDEPLEIKTDEGIWRPDNYNHEYYGEVSLAFAMKKSLNSVAVQLCQQTGTEEIINLIGNALSLGPEEARLRFKPFPSAALGVYSFSPLEIATAYSIFPNGGKKVIPVSVLKVEYSNGNVIINENALIDNLNKSGKVKPVITKSTSGMINEILEGVLHEGGTAYSAVLSSVSSPESLSGSIPKWRGKTGTTNDYADAWFIGYDDTVITAVWLGFDDPSNNLGEGQSGGVVAAPIWMEFMKKILYLDR
jgi:penicillin-binding protein 1A